MSEIRLVLADDHPIYRDGVARTLVDAGGIDVVGQAQVFDGNATGLAGDDLLGRLQRRQHAVGEDG